MSDKTYRVPLGSRIDVKILGASTNEQESNLGTMGSANQGIGVDQLPVTDNVIIKPKPCKIYNLASILGTDEKFHQFTDSILSDTGDQTGSASGGRGPSPFYVALPPSGIPPGPIATTEAVYSTFHNQLLAKLLHDYVGNREQLKYASENLFIDITQTSDVIDENEEHTLARDVIGTKDSRPLLRDVFNPTLPPTTPSKNWQRAGAEEGQLKILSKIDKLEVYSISFRSFDTTSYKITETPIESAEAVEEPKLRGLIKMYLVPRLFDMALSAAYAVRIGYPGGGGEAGSGDFADSHTASIRRFLTRNYTLNRTPDRVEDPGSSQHWMQFNLPNITADVVEAGLQGKVLPRGPAYASWERNECLIGGAGYFPIDHPDSGPYILTEGGWEFGYSDIRPAYSTPPTFSLRAILKTGSKTYYVWNLKEELDDSVDIELRSPVGEIYGRLPFDSGGIRSTEVPPF